MEIEIEEMEEFLSTPSARRATTAGVWSSETSKFLSTPSARRATRLRQLSGVAHSFLSTPSARRATWSLGLGFGRGGHFYPRPPRGGRPIPKCGTLGGERISIHALREEGDRQFEIGGIPAYLFLSTPSARRATSSCRTDFCGSTDFYPRPPRGGRLANYSKTKAES